MLAYGVPVGLGSHVHWDRKLDGRLAQALMSIQAIKGVEIGDGFETARRRGSQAHDEMYPGPDGVVRSTNRAGGLEGGMTNGLPLRVRAAHPDLYEHTHGAVRLRIRDGRIALGSLEGVGFASAAMPDWQTMPALQTAG